MKIPLNATSAKAQPLQRCLKGCADKLGMSEHLVALVMLTFLECLCREVAYGFVVRIPGLGIFYPRLFAKSAKLGKFCIPSFVPSAGWRREVRESCAPTDAGDAAARSFGSNGRRNWKVRTLQETYKKARLDLYAQSARIGIELPRIGEHKNLMDRQ